MASQRYKLRVRLIESYIELQAAHHRRCVIARSNAQVAARLRRKLIIEWGPEFLRNWKLKVGRHHADDGGGLAVNSNALPNDLGIGIEIAPPDFVAEDRDLFRARFVVLCCEIAAKDRRDTDNFEEIFGDVTAGVTLGIVFVGDVDGRSGEVTGHHRERLLRRLQIFVVLSGRNIADTKVVVLIARLRIDQSHADQLLGMRKRKPAEHDCVDDRELRGGAADAKSEYQHGQKAKRFVFEQNSQTDPHILLK